MSIWKSIIDLYNKTISFLMYKHCSTVDARVNVIFFQSSFHIKCHIKTGKTLNTWGLTVQPCEGLCQVYKTPCPLFWAIWSTLFWHLFWLIGPVYRPGNQIPHADTLTRFPVGKAPNVENVYVPETTFILLVEMLDGLPLPYEEIREESKKDAVLSKVWKHLTTKWPKTVDQ